MFFSRSCEKNPWTAGALRVVCNDPAAVTDCAWFRGGWFDPLTIIWKAVSSGKMINRGAHTEGAPSKGASLYVPLRLKPQESKTVRLMLAWYVPCSNVKAGGAPFPDGWGDEGCCAGEACSKSYVPWYASRFENVDEVATHLPSNLNRLPVTRRQYAQPRAVASLPDRSNARRTRHTRRL